MDMDMAQFIISKVWMVQYLEWPPVCGSSSTQRLVNPEVASTISWLRIDAEELRVDVNMLSNNGTRFEALQAGCQDRELSVLPNVALSNNRGY